MYASTKQNGVDTLIYVTRLVNSGSDGIAGGRLLTPITGKEDEPTWWSILSISTDDKFVALAQNKSASYSPLYLVNIDEEKSTPTYVNLPGATSLKEETSTSYATFSRNPEESNLLYLITNAYGDFDSVVTYDILSRSVTHITTPDSMFHSLHPIPWDTEQLDVTDTYIYFAANLDGWDAMFVYPLVGEYKGQVIELKFNQEICSLAFATNSKNKEPWKVVFSAANSRTTSSIHFFDVRDALTTLQFRDGKPIAEVNLTPYPQAQALIPEYRTIPPQLLRYKSFDNLEVPLMYYHPQERRKAVPLVIDIHGGPAAQASSLTKV